MGLMGRVVWVMEVSELIYEGSVVCEVVVDERVEGEFL